MILKYHDSKLKSGNIKTIPGIYEQIASISIPKLCLQDGSWDGGRHTCLRHYFQDTFHFGKKSPKPESSILL